MRARGILLATWVALAFALAGAAHGSDGEEKEFKNTVELFLGAVSETDPTETGPGVGLEYNRRIARLWSVGIGVLEISTNEVSRSWVLLVPFYLHPMGGLSLKAGPGWERAEEASAEQVGAEETKAEFLFRLGVGWEFEIGRRWVVTPEANLDFVDGDTTWVYGVSFGVRF